MEKSWINNILDKAVQEVSSWPSWMQRGQVRVSEATHSITEQSISNSGEHDPQNEMAPIVIKAGVGDWAYLCTLRIGTHLEIRLYRKIIGG